MMSPLIPLPETLVPFIQPYLPTEPTTNQPFVTLTYAASLDSKISSTKTQQTIISHLETKTMTHYIRSKHDAILVGIGTVLADDPGLNCRFVENATYASSPIPVIIDPFGKWCYKGSRVDKTCILAQGKPPIIIVGENVLVDEMDYSYIQAQGGDIIQIAMDHNNVMDWDKILSALHHKGIKSVMVEGGAKVINDLLVYRDADNNSVVNSLILTIGAVYLGEQGVTVTPIHHVSLSNVAWWSGVRDGVMCATISNLT